MPLPIDPNQVILRRKKAGTGTKTMSTPITSEERDEQFKGKPIDKEFGKFVEKERTLRKLNRNQFCKKLDINRNELERIERGERNADGKTKNKINNFFKTNPPVLEEESD